MELSDFMSREIHQCPQRARSEGDVAGFLSSGTAVVSGAQTALGTPRQLVLSIDLSCHCSFILLLSLPTPTSLWGRSLICPFWADSVARTPTSSGWPHDALCTDMGEACVWEVPRASLQQHLSVRRAQRNSGYNFKARKSGAWVCGRLLLTPLLPPLQPRSSPACLLSSSLAYRKFQILSVANPGEQRQWKTRDFLPIMRVVGVLFHLCCHPFPSRALHGCQPRSCHPHPCVTHKATEAQRLWHVRAQSGREPGSESAAGAAFVSEHAAPVLHVSSVSRRSINAHCMPGDEGWGGWHCCCTAALEVVVGRVGIGVRERFLASPALHLLRALDGTLKACALIRKHSHPWGNRSVAENMCRCWRVAMWQVLNERPGDAGQREHMFPN